MRILKIGFLYLLSSHSFNLSTQFVYFDYFILRNVNRHCEEFNVLGFDCEWVIVGGARRPVALLQLASHRGLCALIRLSHLQMVPSELKVNIFSQTNFQ